MLTVTNSRGVNRAADETRFDALVIASDSATCRRFRGLRAVQSSLRILAGTPTEIDAIQAAGPPYDLAH